MRSVKRPFRVYVGRSNTRALYVEATFASRRSAIGRGREILTSTHYPFPATAVVVEDRRSGEIHWRGLRAGTPVPGAFAGVDYEVVG